MVRARPAPAPAGFAHAGRVRGGRRDRRGLRRPADRGLLRVRADYRGLYAGQRRAGLRGHAHGGAGHQGDHRRALRHRSARGAGPQLSPLRGPDRARTRRGGGRRRGDAGGGADRARLSSRRPLTRPAAGRGRRAARSHGPLHPADSGRGARRARPRLLLAVDGDAARRPHLAEAHRQHGVSGLWLSRRIVLRFAVRRLSPRQALRARRRPTFSQRSGSTRSPACLSAWGR